jgi:PAS domain S-box-containing protein
MPAARARDDERVWGAISLALLLAVLVLDSLTDRTLATAVLYLPVVLLSALSRRVRTVVAVAAVAGLFTVVGALVSPARPGDHVDYLIENRVVTALALVACASVSVSMLRSRSRADDVAVRLRSSEQTVARQHDLLSAAGEIGRFGGWSLEVASGVVTWSHEVGHLLGVDPDGSNPLDVSLAKYAPDQRARLRTVVDRCADDGTPFEEELQLRRPDDGRRVWVTASGRAQRDDSGAITHVHGAVQEITRRKEAEAAAERSDRRLRVLADTMPVLVWTTGRDGKIDYFSAGLISYTGTDPEQILGDAWLEVLHPDDREVAWRHWSRAVETEGPYLVEFRIRRYDGEYRWHLTTASPERDEHDRLVAWWGCCVDIHDRRELERRERDLTDRLTWTLESVSDSVVGLDEDWRVTVVNENAVRLLERPREGLVDRLLWEEFPEAAGSVFAVELERAVRDDTPVHFEGRYAPTDRQLEISAYPHSHGLTVYFRDVTEARQIEQRLSHVQRLESLGRLTGGVAHDFNNLLTVVLGSAEVLATRVSADATSLRLAESIASAARRGADLTHSLLAFARKQPLDPTEVDVNALVADTRRLLGRTLGGEITVRTRLSAGSSRCLVDRVQLENAVLNLCINARDALPEGGTLTLETAEVVLDEQGAEHPDDVLPGHYVTVAVSDDGTGISEEDLDRIFEPFFTTKESGHGSGLGLAMVYGFVKQSRGHVTVDSRPGAGTTVRLYLPMSVGAVAAGDRP